MKQRSRFKTGLAPALRCFFCGKPVSFHGGFIAIYDTEAGPEFRGKAVPCVAVDGSPKLCGPLRYPGTGQYAVAAAKWLEFATIAVFTHADCGPDCCYWIPFDRLSEDWESQLQTKNWRDVSAAHIALSQARRVFGIARRPWSAEGAD